MGNNSSSTGEKKYSINILNTSASIPFYLKASDNASDNTIKKSKNIDYEKDMKINIYYNVKLLFEKYKLILINYLIFQHI